MGFNEEKKKYYGRICQKFSGKNYLSNENVGYSIEIQANPKLKDIKKYWESKEHK